ncbi:MAG: hypothetical protein CMJ05_00030 [Pelagibacterales bacterium]|nr:hypothetical protein [Pelagibacterales bacterium]
MNLNFSTNCSFSSLILQNFKTFLIIVVFTSSSFNIFAQTTSTISSCGDFISGPAAWPYVLVATTIADGAASQAAQTFTMNVTSLPLGGANFRVYKTTVNGSSFFGNPVALTIGINTITVAAVTFDRAVKFQFSSGDVVFDALSLNGTASSCLTVLPPTPTSLISSCGDFTTGPTAWPYVLVATTIADGAASQVAQTFTMNVTSLPVGGANFRVYKTTANGSYFFGNAIALTLGSNTITVAAVTFDRVVKFQFSSGDVVFDALSLNGTASSCIPANSLISTCGDFVSGPTAWPYVLVATTIADGAASQAAQTFTMNVTSLPLGGANVRVYKTTANGNDFFGNPVALTTGINSITVAAVTFDRAVKFQFSSGGVVFDALSLNGVNSACVAILGCTDSVAWNYYTNANTDDGSCLYSYMCNNPYPNGLSADNIVDIRGTINWNNMNTDSCRVWKNFIRYKKITDSIWTTKSAGVGSGLCNIGLSTQQKVLQNLTANTTYEYKMKSFYCGGMESGYSPAQQFTTAEDCPQMTNLSVQTFGGNHYKARFSWDTTGAYVFARIALRIDTVGANWQTAGGFGIYFPSFSVNKFGLQSGQSYRAQGRTFCDSNITIYRSWWTSPIFWTQPVSIRLNGGTSINNLDIYPNPTDNIFNVCFATEEIQTLLVRVLNIVGEVFYEESLDHFIGEYTKQISLADYSKGIYLLEITDNQGTINNKIILQ